MRKSIVVMIIALGIAVTVPAFAELQNVTVGGQIRIRGRAWFNAWAGNYAPITRMPVADFGKRALGPFGVDSLYDFDDRGNDLKFVEQKTLVNVKADFTDGVSAFIELADYAWWGEDFRSNYITGVDARANTADDVEVLQAYIEVDEMFGYPLRARIGRQEIVMGKKWLIGSQGSPFLPFSYDAIRLTYVPVDDLTIDAWWAKLAETGPVEEDGDVDFYGVYGTYSGLEALSLSAYWVWVRDAGKVSDTQYGWLGEWVEDLLDLDDYDVTNFHTVGLRAFGSTGGLDYDLELAYQFGEASSAGVMFPMQSLWGVYGDDGADYGVWAGDLRVGYTFDYTCSPRIYLAAAYFGGEDNRDLSFWEWLNPFQKADASLSFNRLFSGDCCGPALDALAGMQDMSNFWMVKAGITANATEKVSTGLSVAYFEVVETFDWPRYIELPGLWAPDVRLAIAPALAFWTQEADDDIGVVSHVWVKYQYSADLSIKLGWERLFTGDALEDGNFIKRNGLLMMSGTDDDDTDYIYFDMGLKF